MTFGLRLTAALLSVVCVFIVFSCCYLFSCIRFWKESTVKYSASVKMFTSPRYFILTLYDTIDFIFYILTPHLSVIVIYRCQFFSTQHVLLFYTWNSSRHMLVCGMCEREREEAAGLYKHICMDPFTPFLLHFFSCIICIWLKRLQWSQKPRQNKCGKVPKTANKISKNGMSRTCKN